MQVVQDFVHQQQVGHFGVLFLRFLGMVAWRSAEILLISGSSWETIGSMGLEYVPTNLSRKNQPLVIINVGKYTNRMDPMEN